MTERNKLEQLIENYSSIKLSDIEDAAKTIPLNKIPATISKLKCTKNGLYEDCEICVFHLYDVATNSVPKLFQHGYHTCWRHDTKKNLFTCRSANALYYVIQERIKYLRQVRDTI